MLDVNFIFSTSYNIVQILIYQLVVIFYRSLQVDEMVAMHEDTRSKYEAALEHMKERICDRYIDHPFKFVLQFFSDRKERSVASLPPPPCHVWEEG